MKIETLEKIPEMMLTEISTPAEPAKAPGSAEAEVFNTGEHAKTTTIFDTTGPSAPSNAPEGPNKAQGAPFSSMTAGQVVTGKTAVNVADFIIPALFAFLAKTAGYELDKKALKLTREDRELLEPATQDYLNSIDLRLSPLQALLVAISVVYGSKVVEILPTLKEVKKPVKNDPPKSAVSSLSNLEDRLKEAERKKREKAEFVATVLKAGPEAGALLIVDKYKVSKAKARQMFIQFKSKK